MEKTDKTFFYFKWSWCGLISPPVVAHAIRRCTENLSFSSFSTVQSRALICRAVKRAGPSIKVCCSRLRSTKTSRSLSFTLELRFLKKFHETSFYLKQWRFWRNFVLRQWEKWVFQVENGTSSFALKDLVALIVRVIFCVSSDLLIKVMQENSLIWYRVNLCVSQNNV